MLIFIFWRMWFSFSRRRLLKKYKPENDKTRKGGVFDEREVGIPKQGIDGTTINSIGFEQPEGRELLQEADVSSPGKDSNIPRENSSSTGRNRFRRLFRRNKKKWMKKQLE